MEESRPTDPSAFKRIAESESKKQFPDKEEMSVNISEEKMEKIT